jgi:hypothetical protein
MLVYIMSSNPKVAAERSISLSLSHTTPCQRDASFSLTLSSLSLSLSVLRLPRGDCNNLPHNDMPLTPPIIMPMTIKTPPYLP